MLWTTQTSTRWQKMKVEDISRQWGACNPFATQVILSLSCFLAMGSLDIALPVLELTMHVRWSQTQKDPPASVFQVFPTMLNIL